MLNKRQKTKNSVHQCQRKMKHLQTLCKECKQWNPWQSGGNLHKGPHFNAILGCGDTATSTKVQHAGMEMANMGASNCRESPCEQSSTSFRTFFGVIQSCMAVSCLIQNSGTYDDAFSFNSQNT